MVAEQLGRKMKLLILSELGFSKIGQNIAYNEIASALQIENSEVEKWAIDGKLLSPTLADLSCLTMLLQ